MIHGSFKLNGKDVILKNRGLQEMGAVQMFIDNEVIRLMTPYTPMLLGALEKSATQGTVKGTGVIRQTAPYSKYQYYGVLMVSSLTGSSWSKGEKKVLTSKKLNHSKNKHPMAGAFWFERMKADKKKEILKGARKIAGSK